MIIAIALASCATNQPDCTRHDFISWKYSAIPVEIIASRADVAPYVSEEVLAGVARFYQAKADSILKEYERIASRTESENEKQENILELIGVAEQYIAIMDQLKKYSHSYKVARAYVVRDAVTEITSRVERESRKDGVCLSKSEFTELSIEYAIPLLVKNANKVSNSTP